MNCLGKKIITVVMLRKKKTQLNLLPNWFFLNAGGLQNSSGWHARGTGNP